MALFAVATVASLPAATATADATTMVFPGAAWDGQPVPLQTDILARWPDGSVRWLLVDFQVAQRAPKSARAFTLRHDPTRTAAPATSPLRVTIERGLTIIVTGPLRLALDPVRLDPLGAAWLDRDGDGRFADNERVTRPAGGLPREDQTWGREVWLQIGGIPSSGSRSSVTPGRAPARPFCRGRMRARDSLEFLVHVHSLANLPDNEIYFSTQNRGRRLQRYRQVRSRDGCS